jgi:hypothetical protein
MPETEFWEEIIPAVKAKHPDFLLIAEVYWNMEHTLQQQGFDLTYDKLLYDRLMGDDPGAVYTHLLADADYQKRMIRFIENHDEPRAASSLGIEKGRAAATMICTLPGTVLLHDGQFIGRQVKLPVQITRQPDETPNYALESFYYRLMAEVSDSIYDNGTWRLLEIAPRYQEADTHDNLLAYSWQEGDDYRLIVVNLTPVWSQGIIKPNDWARFGNGHWRLLDTLSDSSFYRDGDKLADNGLYVELEPFQSRIFHFEPLGEGQQIERKQRKTVFPA